MSEVVVRSPFFYVGDKFKLIPQLKSAFPKKIERFIEPFCGGGSVFLNVKAKKYLVNDIDSYIVKLHKFLVSSSRNKKLFWSKIKSAIEQFELSASFLKTVIPDEYKRKYPKTYFAKYNKKAYLTMRNEFNVDKKNMVYLYLLLIYGFNRFLRFNSKGDFNLPVGNVDFNMNVEKALNDYFDVVKSKDITFYNMDFVKFIEKTKPTKDDFVYLDPPYLITFSEYNKLWTEKDERRLLDLLDKLDARGVRFAVSNVIRHKDKYNEIFDEWAKKYNIIRVKSNYISYHDNTEKGSYEVLVTNC